MAFECMFGRVSLNWQSRPNSGDLTQAELSSPNLTSPCSQRPYIGKSRKEIRDHILSKQIQIKDKDIPRGWSTEAADFVNRVSFSNFYRPSPHLLDMITFFHR